MTYKQLLFSGQRNPLEFGLSFPAMGSGRMFREVSLRKECGCVNVGSN
jgi:hypothetical protein